MIEYDSTTRPQPLLRLAGTALLATLLASCAFDDSRLGELREGPRDVGDELDAAGDADIPVDGPADGGDDDVDGPQPDTPPDGGSDQDAPPDQAMDPDVVVDLEEGPCGNGVQNVGEACDRGGEAADCDDDCSPVRCGDGNHNMTAGEGCDDGGTGGGDGCDANCQVEPNFECVGDPSECFECGDGSLDSTEDCDDGDISPTDGCDATCEVEPNFNCTSVPNAQSSCFECGDGVVSAAVGETCDDGDRNSCTPPCPADCGLGGADEANQCGDDVIACGEACDDDSLGGLDCTDFGFATAGALACTDSCGFDVGACACTGADLDTDDDGECDLLDEDDDGDLCPDVDDPAPTVPGDPNFPALTILFVAADTNGAAGVQPSATDLVLIELFEDSGHTVALFAESADGCSMTTDNQNAYSSAINPAMNGGVVFDVMWISESCETDNVVDGNSDDADSPSWVNGLDIPVIANDDGLFDNLFFGDTVDNRSIDAIEVLDNDDFILAHVPSLGDITVHTTNDTIGYVDGGGQEAPDLVVLAATENATDEFAVFYVEAGDDLLYGATAPQRRVGVGMFYSDNMTELGRSVVDRVLLFAAGFDDADPFIDGDAVPSDCDVCPGIFDPAQIDADGDGMGAACDCDDAVAGCGTDCVTNTDSANESPGYEAPDCYEVACGSDPDVGSLTGGSIDVDCLLADDSAADRQLDDVISTAGSNAGRDRIMVTYDAVGGNTSVGCPGDGYDMRFSAPQIFESQNDGLQITGAGCTYDGVSIVTPGQTAITVQSGGTGTTISGFTITGCSRSGVDVNADDVTVSGLTIDCGSGTGGDRAGVLVTGAEGTRIVGNLFFGHPEDGIELVANANRTTIDHNTFIGPITRGISVVASAADLCVRNNLFVDVADVVSIVAGSDWDAACEADLPDGTYRNAVFDVGDLCASGTCGTDCGAVDCLPTTAQRFFEFSGDWEIDPRVDENGCLDAPPLIDTAIDLGYDRNGAGGGLFEGAGPDIGGREIGVGLCAD